MTNKVNTLAEKQEIHKEKPVSVKKKSWSGRFFMDLLGGDFLAYNWVRRQVNYVFFLAAIALIYIGNSYYAEDMSRKIDDLNRELKELHYEYISAKSELMQQTKQSTIATRLNKSGLKESVEPVRKIIIRGEDRK
ncbi:MAG: FtsL-like putative cell division protein [Bacteroidales bacterium]|jgi:hypothetical protein|nr:FtsL-like putative cell division protein [Bacteroidales bacterium]MDD4085955.1 FtsL-like putative cell division protein [Bacteroidales bacterium]MDY0085240.1 FtsL-like putative cell division protein [Bacteroidales bacterium]